VKARQRRRSKETSFFRLRAIARSPPESSRSEGSEPPVLPHFCFFSAAHAMHEDVSTSSAQAEGEIEEQTVEEAGAECDRRVQPPPPPPLHRSKKASRSVKKDEHEKEQRCLLFLSLVSFLSRQTRNDTTACPCVEAPAPAEEEENAKTKKGRETNFGRRRSKAVVGSSLVVVRAPRAARSLPVPLPRLLWTARAHERDHREERAVQRLAPARRK